MMQRALLPLAALCLLAPNATAAMDTTDLAPGAMGPGHPLYGVDVVFDDLTAGVLKPPGAIAHERASEAFVAAEANDTAGMERALQELEAVANRTNGLESPDGLNRAEAVLLDLRDRVPEQATFGIDTALEAVTEARNRYPTDGLATDRGTEHFHGFYPLNSPVAGVTGNDAVTPITETWQRLDRESRDLQQEAWKMEGWFADARREITRELAEVQHALEDAEFSAEVLEGLDRFVVG